METASWDYKLTNYNKTMDMGEGGREGMDQETGTSIHNTTQHDPSPSYGKKV
jgi:hypothetical protein